MFQKIDLNHWDRKIHYEVYRQFQNPRYDISWELDVTNLLRAVKAQHLSFTLSMIHTIAKSANVIPEFKMRIEDDAPVLYEYPRLSFTYLNQDTHLMKNVVVDNNPDITVFNQQALETISNQKEYFTGPLGNDIYQFSSIPWITFTHISHTSSGNRDYAVPVFDFGKFHTCNGKTVMPFSVEVHHGFIDGYHLGLLADKLQTALNSF